MRRLFLCQHLAKKTSVLVENSFHLKLNETTFLINNKSRIHMKKDFKKTGKENHPERI